jgi:hypothetical protein
MTENAERACRILQAEDMIETIVSVQPRLSLDIMGYIASILNVTIYYLKI